MKCLRGSGSARIARVGRFRRVRRICEQRSPIVRSLTCVRYRSGRIQVLENDDRVSRKNSDEPYGGHQRGEEVYAVISHIYSVFITALYSPTYTETHPNNHAHHSPYFSPWCFLYSTCPSFQSFAWSTTSTSSLPRIADSLPNGDAFLQRFLLHPRQYRFLVSSVCSRTSMCLRAISCGGARRSCQGADSVALAIRDERRWAHADWRLQQHQF